MSDFWARAIGAAHPPAPARDQAPLDAWWAPPRPAPLREVIDSHLPQSPPKEDAPAPRQAQSASATDRCPHCGSGDYFRPSLETKPRCYTCGYPVLHSTSGMMSTEATAAKPARQIRQSREGGYQPQKIIGRIG